MPRKQDIDRAAIQERERRVWDLRVKSWTQERIAKELNIDQSAVSKILKRLSQRFAKALDDEVASTKIEHIARLEHIIDQSMQAWESSRQPVKDARRTKGGLGETEQSRVQTRDGDPRFLAEARAALGDIRKILGADAAKQIDVNWRAKVQDAGFDPETLFNDLVNAAQTRLEGDTESIH